MKIKISELLIDWDLYPRHQVDSANVARLREAIRAGETLPPLIFEKKSRKLVDGFHRHRAFWAELGENAEVEAEGRNYANDKELFLDAVSMNVTHGEKLSPFDRARVLTLASEFKIKEGDVAAALRLSKEDLRRLKVRKTAKVGTTVVPIKHTLSHLAGEKLRPEQVEANEKAGGMRPLFYVNQVVNLFEGNLVDLDNQKLVEAISHLQQLLSSFAVRVTEHRKTMTA